MNELSTILNFVSVLPKVVEALTTCDAIMREHEETQAQKYSEQEYLQSVFRLYKTRKITAEEARKALRLIFKEDAYTINATEVDAYIMKLLK